MVCFPVVPFTLPPTDLTNAFVSTEDYLRLGFVKVSFGVFLRKILNS